MIKITWDKSCLFFELEGRWVASLFYIGNNKFYLKFLESDGHEGDMVCTCINYIDGVLSTLDTLMEFGDSRTGRAAKITKAALKLNMV